MGLIFASFNIPQPQARGGLQEYLGTLTFDSAYASGGESITAAGSGIKTSNIIGVAIWGANAAGSSRNFQWDYANAKMKVLGGAGSSVYSYTPGGGDLKGATNVAGTEDDTDQAAAPVNAGLISTAAAVSGLVAGALVIAAQPDVPRNLVVTITNDQGGGTGGDLAVHASASCSVAVVGTAFDGSALTETISLGAIDAGHKTVADTKFRYAAGTKAFRTVTSATLSNAPTTTALKIGLGVGTRIGLPVPLVTPAYTDILKITVGAAAVAATDTDANAGGVDQTNMTVNTGTTADGNDVAIVYRAAGIEASTGADLSGVVLRASVLTAENTIA